MFKRILAMIMTVVMILGMFTACGGSNEEPSESISTTPNDSNSFESQEIKVDASNGWEIPELRFSKEDAEIVWRYGHNGAMGEHQYTKLADYFQYIVSERTNGRIFIDTYPSEQLGSGSLMLEQVSMGTLDITNGNTAFMSNYGLKEIEWGQIWGITESWDSLYSYVKSDRWQWYKDEFDKKANVKIAGTAPNGEYFLISNFEITDISQLEKVKFRGKDGTSISMIQDKVFGTITTNVAFAELYSAFQTGIINAQTSSIANYRDSAYYEVAPYIYYYPFTYAFNPLFISNLSLEKLSQEDQALIINAASEACDWVWDYYLNGLEPKYWADINKRIDSGQVKYYVPTEEQNKSFLNIVRTKLWPALLEEHPEMIPDLEVIVNDIQGENYDFSRFK